MSNADLVRRLYGYNWAAISDRERGMTAAAELLAPDVEARISPEVGDRTLHGLEEFAIFVQGLEEDFSEFLYEAEDLTETGRDEVSVRGHIRARGRRSQMPLTAAFGHVWTIRDGKAVKVEAGLLSP